MNDKIGNISLMEEGLTDCKRGLPDLAAHNGLAARTVGLLNELKYNDM